MILEGYMVTEGCILVHAIWSCFGHGRVVEVIELLGKQMAELRGENWNPGTTIVLVENIKNCNADFYAAPFGKSGPNDSNPIRVVMTTHHQQSCLSNGFNKKYHISNAPFDGK